MTNTEHSQFSMPSMLGARPLGFHSSVRSSSNLCSSSETECIRCSVSTPPFIPDYSIESLRSLAALRLESFLILRYQYLEIAWHVSPIAKSVRAASSSTMSISPQKHTRIQWDTAQAVETKNVKIPRRFHALRIWLIILAWKNWIDNRQRKLMIIVEVHLPYTNDTPLHH